MSAISSNHKVNVLKLVKGDDRPAWSWEPCEWKHNIDGRVAMYLWITSWHIDVIHL